MYQIGQVIYFDKLKFTSYTTDPKKNRPCLVLYSELTSNGQEKIYFCPLTTSLQHFNKHPYYHHLIEHPVYNHQLCFAKLSSIYYNYNHNQIHDTKIILKKEAFDIIQKLCQTMYHIQGLTDDVKNTLHYINSFVRQEELKETPNKTYQKLYK